MNLRKRKNRILPATFTNGRRGPGGVAAQLDLLGINAATRDPSFAFPAPLPFLLSHCNPRQHHEFDVPVRADTYVHHGNSSISMNANSLSLALTTLRSAA